jgi:excisionase family DNA binding protein
MESLLTVNEVAKAIGMTPFGVYGLVHKKQIPAVKISRRCLRFRPQDIEKWLASKSQWVQERKEQIPIRQARARGKSSMSDSRVTRLVENAKREVLK